MPDHARMPAGIPPKTGASGFVGYPKGRSSLLMFDRRASLRCEFGNRKFWAKGRWAWTVGLNEVTIGRHVSEQGVFL